MVSCSLQSRVFKSQNVNSICAQASDLIVFLFLKRLPGLLLPIKTPEMEFRRRGGWWSPKNQDGRCFCCLVHSLFAVTPLFVFSRTPRKQSVPFPLFSVPPQPKQPPQVSFFDSVRFPFRKLLRGSQRLLKKRSISKLTPLCIHPTVSLVRKTQGRIFAAICCVHVEEPKLHAPCSSFVILHLLAALKDAKNKNHKWQTQTNCSVPTPAKEV